MNNQDRVAFYVTLYGEVQGIGLRKRIRANAIERDLKGWVRNRTAGHVQFHVEGPEREARQLIADLQTGKLGGDISDIAVTRTTAASFSDFIIANQEEHAHIAPSLSRDALQRAKILEEEFKDINSIAFEILSRRHGDQSIIFELMQRTPGRFLGEPFVKQRKNMNFKLSNVINSFSQEMWSRYAGNKAARDILGYSVEGILGSKETGVLLAQRIGLTVPERYQNDVPFSGLALEPSRVIKPLRAAGSRGVFIIRPCGTIHSVRDGRRLDSCAELVELAKIYMKKYREDDRWIAEEFIYSEGVPHDVKVYCFYGKAALVLEVDRNGKKPKYCWRLPDGTITRTGKYENSLFEGKGVLDDYIDLSEKASLKIPSPFLRIDLLKAKEGPVFGEFTAKPGNFHQFDAFTDSWLGGEFAQARTRLLADLINGKRFTEFDQFIKEVMGTRERRGSATTA
jgi:acylphosphatase